MENREHPQPTETAQQEPAVAQPNEHDTDFNAETANEEIALLLEEARNKADEHWNQLLRARADMENMRRRGERDLESAHKYALERFAQDLLPVKDSLELGLAASSSTTADSGELTKLREGMELTHKLLKAAMEKFQIKELNPVGEIFNPQLHQAMTTQEDATAEPNTVLIVCQKGYTLYDRLIRPAMVIVSKLPSAV